MYIYTTQWYNLGDTTSARLCIHERHPIARPSCLSPFDSKIACLCLIRSSYSALSIYRGHMSLKIYKLPSSAECRIRTLLTNRLSYRESSLKTCSPPDPTAIWHSRHTTMDRLTQHRVSSGFLFSKYYLSATSERTKSNDIQHSEF